MTLGFVFKPPTQLHGGFRFLVSDLTESFGRCEIRAVSPPANGSLAEGEMALCLKVTKLGINKNLDPRTTAPRTLIHSIENCTKTMIRYN